MSFIVIGVTDNTLVIEAISYIDSLSTSFEVSLYVNFPKDFSAIILLSSTIIICAPGKISEDIAFSITSQANCKSYLSILSSKLNLLLFNSIPCPILYLSFKVTGNFPFILLLPHIALAAAFIEVLPYP